MMIMTTATTMMMMMMLMLMLMLMSVLVLMMMLMLMLMSLPVLTMMEGRRAVRSMAAGQGMADVQCETVGFERAGRSQGAASLRWGNAG